ncbi:S9 family peptidase [Catenovulum sp. SM1970]|uniref:prolyl oligopeptidase family serine peptidase n=1 Tax=Marinifaba aquimaris TaxID=2741323 RepID=UPI00157473F7|nr:prolyl oligopeptidase family serine peptidase [Marinifaba aquimaris]NTS75791.1 S9 family peptidase [Marinifaba aquimaris]
MIKKIAFVSSALALAVSLAACQQSSEQPSSAKIVNESQAFSYPATQKGDVVDTYFGQQIADPYRWLEDDRSAETGAWVVAQNEVTNNYLSQVPYREQIKSRLAELMNYEKVSAPFVEGQYTYFYKNDGLQNQYVLYRLKADGTEEVFLDPNTFSADGTTSMSGLTFSKDGTLAAYQTSKGGSDWRHIHIIDVETKQAIEAPLKDVKFSSIAWLGNKGFFYSSYDKPKGSELSAKTDQHKLYYHQLGTAQHSDKLVFGGTAEQKHRYINSSVTDDEKYLLIYGAISTSGNRLFVKDLANETIKTVLAEPNADTQFITSVGNKVYLQTNLDAPNRKLVSFDANTPELANWTTVIAETENVLSASAGAGSIFAAYMQDAVSKVKQYDYQGQFIRDIGLPGVGTARGFKAKKSADSVYFSFTNYKTPTSIYHLDVNTGKVDLHQKPKTAFDSDLYESKQVFYTSKDGTKVPMILTYKKGIELNGQTPTILYGYGGFDISLTPRFSGTVAGWLDLGGIWAVANLRGGGEYGKAWHKAGTQMQKQNVFDDFIAAADYLVDNKYTSKEYLAIHGRSNGGLLVGAVMTQRPELFQVALPGVGVLDMLRYHTFTAGAGWAYDYGTAEQSEAMFNYLLDYSPVHNVEEGIAYPATLVLTADHDDRVVPAHSFKFAAELQAKQEGIAPTMIRIDVNAGHGAGTPTSKIIDLWSDMYGFTLYNMGVKAL